MSFGTAPFAQLAFGQGFDFAVLAAARVSAFNFCNPFDHVLPPADGTIGKLDRAHLWGLYSGIAIGVGSPAGTLPLLGVGK